MKKLIIIIFALLFSIHLKSQTVYITETGKKYHAKNCDVAKTCKKGIELSEAKKQGYEACKVCKNATEPKQQKTQTDKKEKKTN